MASRPTTSVHSGNTLAFERCVERETNVCITRPLPAHMHKTPGGQSGDALCLSSCATMQPDQQVLTTPRPLMLCLMQPALPISGQYIKGTVHKMPLMAPTAGCNGAVQRPLKRRWRLKTNCSSWRLACCQKTPTHHTEWTRETYQRTTHLTSKQLLYAAHHMQQRAHTRATPATLHRCCPSLDGPSMMQQPHIAD